MRVVYGRTWWGQQLLRALERVDHANRLGRGRTYSNTGRVKDVQIAGSQVRAVVQGSQPRPYSVSVSFQPLDEDRVATVYALVESDPLILAAILNGELPKELFALLRDNDIVLLPQSWADCRGRCSCPDSASVCKHIAGTIYQLVTHVDQDPWVLFSLRGVDLLGHFVVARTETKIVKYPLPRAVVPPELLAPDVELDLDGIGGGGGDGDNAGAGGVEPTGPLAKVELLHLAPQASFITSCLSPSPAFSTAPDFRAVLTAFYAAFAKSHRKVLQLDGDGLGLGLDKLEDGALERLGRVLSQATWEIELPASFLTINAAVRIVSSLFSLIAPADLFGAIPHTAGVPEGGVTLSLDTAFRLALKLGADGPADSASFRFFAASCQVCALVANAAAFIPDAVPMGTKDAFSIVWKPLTANVAVQRQFAALADVYMRAPCLTLTLAQPKAAEILDGFSAGMHLVTALLTHFVRKVQYKGRAAETESAEGKAFFRGDVFTPATLAQKSTGPSIQRYFGVFDLMKADFDLHLRVVEAGHASNGDGDDTELSYEVFLLVSERTAASDLVDVMDTDGGIAAMHFAKQPQHRHTFLKFLATLKGYLPDVGKFVTAESIMLRGSVFEAFLLDTSEILSNLGVSISLPTNLASLLKPRLVAHAVGAGGRDDDSVVTRNTSYLQLSKILEFRWKIAVGGQLLDPDEAEAKFQRVVAKGRRLFRFQEQFVTVSADDLKKMLTKATTTAPPSKLAACDLFEAALSPDSVIHIDAALRDHLQQMLRVNPIAVPQTLQATLRDYQVRGFRWMASNLSNGLGGILADDMGLGKTIQTIATLLWLVQEGKVSEAAPALLVVPVSLISNWLAEMARFGPSLNVAAVHGAAGVKTVLGVAKQGGQKRQKITTQVFVTSYGTLRTSAAAFKQQKYGVVVLDEAQTIKNHTTAISKTVRAVPSTLGRIALTGTPVENRLAELWSLFDFAMPGFLGTLKDFNAKIAKPIEKERDQEKVVKLQTVTGPFMMRRLKSDPDIAKDLPAKVITKDICHLSPQQAGLYQSVVDEITASIEKAKTDPEYRKRRGGLVLKAITKLKQICNHPRIYVHKPLDEGDVGDVDDGGDGGDQEAADKTGPAHDLAGGSAETLNETITASGKLEMLNTVLDQVLPSGDKVLVFTQYVTTLHLLEQVIARQHLSRPAILHGGMNKKARDAAVHRFQTDPTCQVFILSIRAGGVGLNLTAANHCVIFDRVWNPAVENQAIDRAYRIGQRKTVMVHILLCTATIEERIDQMIESKRDLSDLSVKAGERWLADMSDDDLLALFRRDE